MSENRNCDMKYTIAIQCFTYNHEPYIRDALEGFIMQQTNFPFVAIVHDDASTDGTADIIREYAAKYPEIIKPIYETENQYSKHDGNLGHIMTAACESTGAKYIALCEGDDYWTDPLKLQKQVDFLESHPDYSMCFTDAMEFWQNGEYANKLLIGECHDRDIMPIELFEGMRAPTASVIYNSCVLYSNIYNTCKKIRRPAFGDLQLFLCCGKIGKIKYLHDCTTTYRRLPTGAAMQFSKNQWPHLRTRIAVAKIFGKAYVRCEKKRIAKYFIPTLKSLFNNFPDNIKLATRLFWFTPFYSSLELSWIFKSIKARFIK